MPAGDFPNQVNVQPSPAVEGDFASTNPRAAALAGPGGFVAGAAGVTIGRFVWYGEITFDVDDTSQPVQNSFNGVPALLTTTTGGGNAVLGFVGRNQQGIITTYLQASGMLIPAGFPVVVFSAGDFWVKNAGTNQATQGMKCYASLATGQATFAAPGTATVNTTNGSISAGSVSFTGSISGNVLTVTAVASGVLAVGSQLSGGTGMVTNTAVVAQISGTANGTGTYALNIPEQTVPLASLTGTYGVLNVTSTISTTNLAPGQLLSGTGGGGVAANTYITQLGTGTGGVGTYYLNNTQTVSQTTIGYTSNVETKFWAMSGGQTGELVKISSWLLG
jgi:hypothetical protein